MIFLWKTVWIVCQQECERYNTTWACPPAVGTLDECARRIHAYDKAVFFSSVAEVSDIMNMEEMLSTRKAHEDLTSTLGEFLKEEGYDIFILSTESCDICAECEFPKGRPCRHPDRMHPCLESHGVVVNEIVEREQMEYNLGRKDNSVVFYDSVQGSTGNKINCKVIRKKSLTYIVCKAAGFL